MQFDFLTLYKDYSNAQLLKIVQQPDNYQPDAVSAANQVLATRQITDVDLQTVHEEMAAETRPNQYVTAAGEILESMVKPEEQPNARKLFRILLVLVGIRFVYELFYAVPLWIVNFRHMYYCREDGGADCFHYLTSRSDLFSTLPVLYLPVIFYLLYQKRRWGWMLLFAENVHTIFYSVLGTYEYAVVTHRSFTGFLVYILLEVGFAVFLWRPVLAEQFGATRRTKRETLTVAIALSLVNITYTLLRLR
jgi:hypothetical protein